MNMAIWGIFLNATLRAAVHLGQDYEANLRYVKNHLWNNVGQLFNETGKLSSEQKEITGVNTVNFKELTCMSTRLLCSKAYQITNAKADVFSDSALCVGKMTWKRKIHWYSENNHFKDMNRMDGMPTKFEWKILPGITTLGILEKIQSLTRDLQCEPEHFKDRIIFMSMYNDIAWGGQGNTERCEYHSQTVAEYARKCPRGHRSFLGLGSEKKWYGTYTDKPVGSWDRMAEDMMLNFSDSGHPMFRASSAFESGELRSKGHGKTLVLFSTVAMKTSSCFSALQFLQISSVSTEQQQIYATNYPKIFGLRKPATLYHLETTEIPTGPSIAENSYQYTATAKPGARIRATNRTIVGRPEIIQTMLLCGFEACRNRTTLL